MLAMAANMSSMTRATIGPELEKKLGHPVTDFDWWLYQQEEEKKRQAQDMAAQQEQARAVWANFQKQFWQLANDRQKIIDFVWAIGVDKL